MGDGDEVGEVGEVGEAVKCYPSIRSRPTTIIMTIPLTYHHRQNNENVSWPIEARVMVDHYLFHHSD
jgi:hypothetical protein